MAYCFSCVTNDNNAGRLCYTNCGAAKFRSLAAQTTACAIVHYKNNTNNNNNTTIYKAPSVTRLESSQGRLTTFKRSSAIDVSCRSESVVNQEQRKC